MTRAQAFLMAPKLAKAMGRPIAIMSDGAWTFSDVCEAYGYAYEAMLSDGLEMQAAYDGDGVQIDAP